MGTAAYVLCGRVTNAATFVNDVHNGVADAKYVATLSGAYQGIVVLDMPQPTNLDPDRTAISGCGGLSQTVLHYSSRDQLKFSPMGVAGRWSAVTVGSGADAVATQIENRAMSSGATLAETALVNDGPIQILVNIEAADEASADRAVNAAAQAPNITRMATSKVVDKWQRP